MEVTRKEFEEAIAHGIKLYGGITNFEKAAGIRKQYVKDTRPQKNGKPKTYLPKVKEWELIKSAIGWDKESSKADEFALIRAFDIDVSAGPGRLITNENVKHHVSFRRDWLRKISPAQAAQLAIVYVSGDSMEPTLYDGDSILVDTTQTKFTKDGIYVVQFDGDGLVKRLQYNPQKKTVKIISDNPKYQPIEISNFTTFKVIGKALWTGRKL